MSDRDDILNAVQMDLVERCETLTTQLAAQWAIVAVDDAYLTLLVYSEDPPGESEQQQLRDALSTLHQARKAAKELSGK